MKVEIDFIEGHAKLNFQQIKDLIDEASMKGYEAGVKDQKAKDRLDKVQENSNVSKPVITKVPPKPPKCVVSENNKEMLEKFLGGKLVEEEKTKEAMLAEEWYRRGHQDGFNAGESGAKPKFDPTLHVDNSVYGYASIEEVGNLNKPNGHMTILRDKNDWKAGTKVAFVKITPHRSK